MCHQERIAAVWDEPPEPVDDPDPAFRGRQQHDATIGTDPPAIKSSCDFLAGNAWQIKRKISILVHGGCGTGGVGND